MTAPKFDEDYADVAISAEAAVRLADIARAAAADVGARLTTVSLWRPGMRDLVRIFSTMPEVYRVGGISRELGEDWVHRCVELKESFLAADESAIGSDAFEHQDVLGALNLGAAINAVVVGDGRFLGCLNLLDAAGTYSASSVRRADAYTTRLADIMRAL